MGRQVSRKSSEGTGLKTGKIGLFCSAAAVTGMLSTGFVLSTTGEVQAQQRTSLFELIFNPRAREKRRLRQQHHEQQRLKAKRRAAAPKVRISAPKVYTYKPDTMKTVDLTPLSTVEIASADPYAGPFITSAFDESRRFLEGQKITATKEVGEALIAYYSENHDFVWIDGTAPNDNARAALAVMERAAEVGLSPADYRIELPTDGFDMTAMADRQRELMLFEMNMSAKALTYVLDATRGRIDPNRLSGYHDFERKKVDLASALGNLAATADAGVYLSGSNPGNDKFKALVAALAEMRGADQEEMIVIAKGTFLKPGTKNPELSNVVAAIRKRGSDKLLVDHGLTLYEFETGGSDRYSPELVKLVKDFQRENGLSVDGIVGKMTISKLTDMSNEDKVDKLVLAMERLRWLPRSLGTRHVFINQPAYRATYVANGKDSLSMRAIVGKRSNQTSFFQDEIERVEFNPYWGVPGSIIVNEMLPKLRQDPSYLDRLGYEVTDRRGRRISSRSVNWWKVGVNVPVDVRQPPGRNNALGELKILFPNEHAIYMHDTPTKKLFERDARAFSHGCVRLQDPRGMAAAVLGSTREHVDAQVEQGSNLAEHLQERIPVYVSYFTAWPQDNGGVEYYADMYGRDKRLDEAIARTNKARGNG